MKKITKYDFERFYSNRGGRTPSKEVKIIMKMKVGECFVFSKEEWTLKTNPHGVASNIKNIHGMEYRAGKKEDGSVAFMRIK